MPARRPPTVGRLQENDRGLLAASGGRKLGCWSFVGAPASQALRQLNADFILINAPSIKETRVRQLNYQPPPSLQSYPLDLVSTVQNAERGGFLRAVSPPSF